MENTVLSNPSDLHRNCTDQYLSIAHDVGSHIAVRTFGSTTILDVQTKPNIIPESPSTVQLTDIANIFHSEVGNRSLVDVRLCSTALQSVLVNDQGAVYTCSFERGQKTM